MSYRTGRDFEWQVRDDLLAEGYWVIRAAGSKTKADLIAIKLGQILIVQCKRNNEVRPPERREVIRIAAMIDAAIPIIAYRHLGITRPQYDRLTGPGPKDRAPFLTDETVS